MRACLSSNPFSPVLIVGPVRMFAVAGAENSHSVFSAMFSNTGARFSPKCSSACSSLVLQIPLLILELAPLKS